MDQGKFERYTREQGCEWKSNPPHASHFGGAWERQISTIRRVSDAMLLNIGSSQLDHELLVTLMPEVAGIVSNRPLTAISTDIDQPSPLTPAMLLTTKKRPLSPPPGKFVDKIYMLVNTGEKLSTGRPILAAMEARIPAESPSSNEVVRSTTKSSGRRRCLSEG